jgi:hypothetical protein
VQQVADAAPLERAVARSQHRILASEAVAEVERPQEDAPLGRRDALVVRAEDADRQ